MNPFEKLKWNIVGKQRSQDDDEQEVDNLQEENTVICQTPTEQSKNPQTSSEMKY